VSISPVVGARRGQRLELGTNFPGQRQRSRHKVQTRVTPPSEDSKGASSYRWAPRIKSFGCVVTHLLECPRERPQKGFLLGGEAAG
jgi:hypothetical protein